MKTRIPTNEGQCEVGPPGPGQDISAPGDAWGAIAADCSSMAEELLCVLLQETACLKAFQGRELLQILPRKELLTRELENGLKSLKHLRGEMAEGRETPHLTALRRNLAEVYRVNRFNEVFIKGSLDYWQGLMAVFTPQTYGPGTVSSSPPPAATPRGFTFSREV